MNLTYLEVDHQKSHYDCLNGDQRRNFLDRLAVSWIYHDHALEGVVLSETELHRAIENAPVRNFVESQTQKSLQRQLSLITFLYDSAKERREISVEFIRELHVRLCDPRDENAGRYRKRDTSPGVYNLNIVPAASISYYFRKFLDTWEEELKHLHPIRAAAIAHFEFMRVFPFDERTGMVGRMLMNYILISQGYPPAIIHALDRHHYFSALDGYRTDMMPVVIDAVSSTIGAARTFSSSKVEPDRAKAAL